MLRVIEGNLLHPPTDGLICHQVNCRGVMGAGIAKPLKQQYPDMFRQYKDLCDSARFSSTLLGSCQIVRVSTSPDRWVVNIFGQDGHGTDIRRTNYGAVGEAFRRLAAHNPHRPVYVPYGMGCGLAGGDFDIYSEIIEFHLPDAIVIKLPE